MQKSLERIERLERPELDGKQMQLDLTVNERSGREVLHIENLHKNLET